MERHNKKRPGVGQASRLARKMTYLIYRPSVRRLLQVLGIQKTLKHVYWRVLYLFNPDITLYGKSYRAPNPHLLETHTKGIEGERVVIDAFVEDVKSIGGTVFDVGGFEGLYTMVSSVLGAENVVMVEPSEERVEAAKSIYRENNAGGVSFVTAALSTLDSSEENSAPVVSFKDLVDEYGVPDIMKIDIEGAEMLLMEEAEAFLSEIGVIYCEIHKNRIQDYDGSEEEIRDILNEHDFTVETLYDRGDNVFIRAVSR